MMVEYGNEKNKKLRGENGKVYKFVVSSILIFVMCFSAAIAENANGMQPNEVLWEIDELWGISRDALKSEYPSNYVECEVGKSKALMIPGIAVNQYSMDVYYIFGEKTWNETGYTYNGLSKITFLLSEGESLSNEGMDECYKELVEDIGKSAGSPDSVSKSVSTWNVEDYKIEVGKGKFKNYNGSDRKNVAIVITALHIDKPVTPTPSPKPTPKPTSTPKPTPQKVEYGSLDYNGVSRYPDNYTGKYVKFTGIVVQAVEGWGIYTLRVASRYEKYQYIDGYSTDDIVYVVVSQSDVEGGRILEDDMITVWGKYDGIETYTALFGNAISIPRIDASRVKIQ